MKNILFILILFFLGACKPEPPFSTTIYRIYNSTKQNVELRIFYNRPAVAYIDTFNFINNPIVLKNEAGKGDGYFPIFVLADSAFITFDDSLRITYKRFDSNPRNILHVDVPGYTGYSGGKTDENKARILYEYNYYITEDDYNNAIQIK